MSVANTFTSQPTNANNATFQAWGSAIANAVSASGWVKTVDANQINWATVSSPNTATNLIAGYEVWHMNDTGAGANQASNPVFMKFEYASGAVSNNNPQLIVTFATGCNSSGGLTGAISARHFLEVSNSTNTVTSVYSGDVNRFQIALWGLSVNATMNTVATSTLAAMLSVERTKDASGNDTNEGLLLCFKKGTSSPNFFQQYLNLTAGPTGVEGAGWSSLMPTANIGLATGVQTAVYPVYHSKGVFLNPGMGVLTVYAQVVSELQTLSVPIYGQNHTYMCFSNAMYTIASRGGNANTIPMMRWE